MNGDDFPKINDDFQGSGERREVVMKFAQIYVIGTLTSLTFYVIHRGTSTDSSGDHGGSGVPRSRRSQRDLEITGNRYTIERKWCMRLYMYR